MKQSSFLGGFNLRIKECTFQKEFRFEVPFSCVTRERKAEFSFAPIAKQCKCYPFNLLDSKVAERISLRLGNQNKNSSPIGFTNSLSATGLKASVGILRTEFLLTWHQCWYCEQLPWSTLAEIRLTTLNLTVMLCSSYLPSRLIRHQNLSRINFPGYPCKTQVESK